jgi:hypothetical protein
MAGVRGDHSPLGAPQVRFLSELASLPPTQAASPLWLRATAGPAELKIAV